jgi:hypothetical protein
MGKKSGGGFGLPYFPLRIVSIDLGETTGVAMYDLRFRSLTCASLSNPEQVILLLSAYKSNVTLMERLPNMSSVNSSVDVVYNTISLYDGIILISPGEWKPIMKVRKLECSKATNQHEKDALSILRFYLFTNWGSEIEWKN